MGYPAGLLLRKVRKKAEVLAILLADITATAIVGILLNRFLFSTITLNYMLMGVSASAAFSKMIDEAELEELTDWYAPILGVSLLTAIVDLGAPLDYHLILGAGLYTFVYIAAAAVINEIIAVIAAKKGFELAGEIS